MNDVMHIPGAGGRYISDLDVRHHVVGLPTSYDRYWGESPRCGWDLSDATVDEDCSWREMGDTFTEGDLVSGLMVSGLRCRCGKINGVQMRWRADTAEVIHAVLRRLAESGAIDLRKLEG